MFTLGAQTSVNGEGARQNFQKWENSEMGKFPLAYNTKQNIFFIQF